MVSGGADGPRSACVATPQTWELFGELQSNGNPKEALAAYTKVCGGALWIFSSLMMRLAPEGRAELLEMRSFWP